MRWKRQVNKTMDIWLKIVLWFFGITVGLSFAVNLIFGDEETRKTMLNLIGQFLVAAAAIVAAALAMTFVVKPVLAWFLGLF